MNIFGTKEVTFQGQSIPVPTWVNWVWQNSNGAVYASQYEPFVIDFRTGWESVNGQWCVLSSPEVKPHIERVSLGE